jgi:hypothetical protein
VVYFHALSLPKRKSAGNSPAPPLIDPADLTSLFRWTCRTTVKCLIIMAVMIAALRFAVTGLIRQRSGLPPPSRS